MDMPLTDDRFVTHLEPVWRDRSNFIIAAELDDAGQPKYEQLFARQVSDNQFEVCCIPYFLYNVALGDVVETQPKDGRQYVVREVVKSSGRYVFRVWLGGSDYSRAELAERLNSLGALVEWRTNNLVTIDATDQGHAQQIADYLAEGDREEHFVYETGLQ
jgi:hypothetical protein